jgi:uncharacterized membrane protein YphA (DoxX/SURF4 family)
MTRQSAGWIVLRVCIGVFFICEGIGKLRWFTDASILAARLGEWAQAAPPGSIAAMYLERVALPYTSIWARLVPLGELVSGVALVAGFRISVFALIAFFMAMNFHVGSGALFKYSFLTNGYGLPVVGSTLALALGGATAPRIKKLKVKPERA